MLKTLPLKTCDFLHYDNQKTISTDYIYLISYKIAKKGKSSSKSLPLLKNDITGSEPTVTMLDT